MLVVMSLMGGFSNNSDVYVDMLVLLLKGGAFNMAVLMNSRHGATPMIAMERRKYETYGQEYEKAGDKAVPFHDPEQRA